MFRFALACAEQADDWNLRAYVLDGMALQAIRTGRPDEGLTLTEQALVRADRLTETEQAMLHTDRARAGQDAPDQRDTDRNRHRRGSLRAATPAHDPPFLANYNAAFLAGNTGHALFDLAVLGYNLTQAPDPPLTTTNRLQPVARRRRHTHSRAMQD